MKCPLLFIFSIIAFQISYTQENWDANILETLPTVLEKHRNFVSIPNVSAVPADMYKNLAFVKKEFEALDFNVAYLESSTLPVFLAEKIIDKKKATILFYLHLDGQPADPKNWDQKDPFIPVLK